MPDCSATKESAVQLGHDVVRIGVNGTLQVNGVSTSQPDAAHPEMPFDDGALSTPPGPAPARLEQRRNAVRYGLKDFLNLDAGLGLQDGPGSVQGLLGSDTGQANDVHLPDGTVLPQPPATADLLGALADAWRVAPDHLLLSSATAAPMG